MGGWTDCRADHRHSVCFQIGLSAEASAEAPHTHLTGNVRNFDIVVNITSVEDALLVSVESSTVVQITLHLGLQPEPNKNSSLLNTTLPSSGWQEGEDLLEGS